MTDWHTEEATEEHIQYIAAHLDPEDERELRDCTGREPVNVIRQSVLESQRGLRKPTVGLDGEGRVICMWGLGERSPFGRIAYPWLISTPLMAKYAKHMLRATKADIETLRGRFARLEGIVDARHHRAVKYIRWLGFTIEPAEPFPNGVLFHGFYMDLM